MMVKAASCVSVALASCARPARHAAPAAKRLFSAAALSSRRAPIVADKSLMMAGVARPLFMGPAALRLKGLSMSMSTTTTEAVQAEGEQAVTEEQAVSDVESEEAPAMETSNTVFVGNLSWETSDDSLLALFEELGANKATVVMDNYTGRSRGYGYVTFESTESAEAAISKFHDSDLDGRTIRCEIKGQPAVEYSGERRAPRARREKVNDDDRRLYLGNLAWELEDEDLVDLCTKYGTVERARVIMNQETGMSRGFGFVTMSSPEETRAVVDELHDLNVNGRYLKVNMAIEGGKPGGGSSGPRIVIGGRKASEE